MAVNITKSALAKQVEEIRALDEKISAAKGDTKVLQAQAFAHLSNPDTHTQMYFNGFAEADFIGAVELAESLETQLADVRDWIQQQVDEQVAATRKDSAGTVEGLKATRDELVAKATAMRTILETMGDEKDLPEIPKGKRGGNTGGTTRTVKTAGARYYRVQDGETIDQPDSQNSPSSLAYYYSKHVNGDRMSMADFAAWALKTHKVDVKQATAWEMPLNDKISVGMRVVEADKQMPEARTPKGSGPSVKVTVSIPLADLIAAARIIDNDSPSAIIQAALKSLLNK